MKRFIPIALILILMAVIYFSGIYKMLTFEMLRYHHLELTDLVNTHPLASPLIFIGLYIVVTALSLPVGVFLSVIGGYLFKQPLSILYIVSGATIGATLLFLSAKTAIGDLLKKKAGPKLKKMEAGFSKNAASYLLFLRFIPLFPFWLVNLAPAFFNVRLTTFIWTTFVGILPGAFVFTQAGRGLNAIFENRETFSLGAVFNWQLRIALICLGIFMLVPIFYKKWRGKKDARR